MTSSPLHSPIRPEWLTSQKEAPLDAAIPVIDSHHHLYDRPGVKYLLDEYLQDIYGGHNVRATVFVQARAMLRLGVPEHLQPLGETEFANGVAAMSASGLYGDARVCAGIVGQADLTLGDAIRPVLEKHIAIAGGPADEGGRFRGIRQTLAWDADASLDESSLPDIPIHDGIARVSGRLRASGPLEIELRRLALLSSTSTVGGACARLPYNTNCAEPLRGNSPNCRVRRAWGRGFSSMERRADATRTLSERHGQAQRAGHAAGRIWLRGKTPSSVITAIGRRMATVDRNLHRNFRF